MLRAAKQVGRLLLLCCLLCVEVRGKSRVPPLIERVYSYASENGMSIGHFESEMYLKFTIDNNRRNMAMRLIPFVGKQERGKRSYMGEGTARWSYTAPGIIDRKETAFYCTMPYVHGMQDVLTAIANVSVYSPTLLHDRLLSPMHRKNHRFYRYKRTASYWVNGSNVVRFLIRPKVFNMQLVKGYMDVDEETGRVRTFYCEYNYNTQHITVSVELGTSGSESLLPKHIHLTSSFRFLGNSSRSEFSMTFNYHNLLPYDRELVQRALRQRGYDLSYLYHLNSDSTATEHSPEHFDSRRPVKLTAKEDSILRDYTDRTAVVDTLHTADTVKQRRNIHLGNIEDMFLGSHYVRLGLHGTVRIPPLVTPSMLEWSNRKGLSLRTSFRFNTTWQGERSLAATLRLGYNFRRREFYWKLPADLVFAPRHNGTLHLEAGNGNRIYNSAQAEEVREQLSKDYRYDSLLNAFNQYRFDYYNDLFAKISLSYDPVTGLHTRLGLVYHERRLTDWNEEAGKYGIGRTYRSLAPNVYLEWTPGLYYWRNGKQKKPLFTKWPTFSAEYEKGVTAAGCHNKYERWEFETKYRINLYALRTVYLRIGGGLYTDRSSTHFVDYSNFHYSSLPGTWNDHMNGQFESLDSRWYNESEYYARACASYESPMLLFSYIRPLTQYVKRERIYCNLLTVHALKPYTEIGYSIATHLFDIGIFAGVANRKAISFGWSFALRLFED